MCGGAFITASTAILRARCSTRPGDTRGPATFSASWRSRGYCCCAAGAAVRLEMVRAGRRKDCRRFSMLTVCPPLPLLLVITVSAAGVLDRNLALLSVARVSAWASTESRSSLSVSSESNSRDLSSNSWLLNLDPPRALVLLLAPSLGEILTLFIFLLLSPVSPGLGCCWAPRWLPRPRPAPCSASSEPPQFF